MPLRLVHKKQLPTVGRPKGRIGENISLKRGDDRKVLQRLVGVREKAKVKQQKQPRNRAASVRGGKMGLKPEESLNLGKKKSWKLTTSGSPFRSNKPKGTYSFSKATP